MGGYYSSGEFAKMAGVTTRTIRYYDNENILKPSAKTESGARKYTDADFARLQQILLFRYLGFSLDDIREMTMASADRHYLLESLQIQKKLVQERIEQMQEMSSLMDETIDAVEKNGQVDWTRMLRLIPSSALERSMKTQYQNAANISARISLHREYSTNKEGWFPWIFRHLDIREGMRILEVGCGNGALWTENREKIPENVKITLSDISEGMIRDVSRALGEDGRFSFLVCDCRKIPLEDQSFDLVIADHVLFYADPVESAVKECRRVLRPGGRLAACTYGKHHMQEVTELVQEFNPQIVLSAERLYEKFGLENGEEILGKEFPEVKCLRYPDSIRISKPGPLIEYILSCHGNQNQVLLDHYQKFHDFVQKKTGDGFTITKDAGMFLCS